MRYTVGVDVGGTFTDFVLHDRTGNQVSAWKQLTVPGDPVTGILTGIDGRASHEEIANFRIGTTVATNAVLERSGAVVAYITTRGFRDVPFIQRGNRRFHYDMNWVKPKPLVKRRHCFELTERLNYKGEITTPLDEAELREIAARIKADPSIGAVAICLLFSYLNPAHEIRARDVLAEELPGLPVSTSYEVVPKWKEYERASTTIADAYLKPIVASQMREMKRRLEEGGQTAPKAVIKSNGGETLPEAAADFPIHLLVSGPSGGVIASRFLAETTKTRNLVTLDMGGTSTDVATVVDGKERFTTSFEIEWGVPIQIPMLDIRTIGAGGGSIAWIDKGGMLRVGPQSAGAAPGPACYGRGGANATVTDAHVVLGRISPANFLGGKMRLDVEAARAATKRLADRLGMSIDETAVAILRIATINMIGALRSVLVEGGFDHRDFVLAAFGGAGPTMAADVIAEMGISTAIIPHNPGQFSAYGFLHTNARVDRQRTLMMTSRDFDAARAAALMQVLIGEGVDELATQNYSSDLEIACRLDMRYQGQNYELELEVPPEIVGPEGAEGLWQAFHDAHRARFGFDNPGETIEIVTFSTVVSARTVHPVSPRLKTGDLAPVPRSRREVGFARGRVDTPIFWRDDLLASQRIDGPAIVEEAASVTIIPPGQNLTVDPFGHLVLNTDG
ncbi:hydantoinase/oxoprolinase family protein [Marinimicrococcus flavescens]|uniref:Hydantoinase/oxoprolinase family protein n=1 Tax=Marinimicrococcus flavescens TaxID=3031815 RepID=A0AAP3XS35_9PROT|nr:hydantoinase/oxoprolinase family protein [Marinimicrococcus flavescens]